MATFEESVDKAISVSVKRAQSLADKALADAKAYTDSSSISQSDFVAKIVEWLVNTVKCVHSATYPSNGNRTATFTAVVGKTYLIRQWISDYAGATQGSQTSTLTVQSGATALLTLADYYTHRARIIRATSTTVTYYSQNAQSNWHAPANVEVYQLD